MTATKPPYTSPRGLRDHFAAVRADRHCSSAVDATEDIERSLREILLVVEPDATEALKLLAQARDLLLRAHEAIDRSIGASKRR